MLLRMLTGIALLLSWASGQDKGNDTIPLKRGMFSLEGEEESGTWDRDVPGRRD